MNALLAAARLQAATFRRMPGDLLALVTTPLFSLMFVAITRQAGRSDLTAYAVLAPAVIGMLGMALLTGGEVISADRWSGTLELALASPTPVPVIVLGRILTVTAVSLVAVVESWLAAYLAFGVAVPVPHAGVFVLVLAVTALAMAGTATAMAALFVLTRSARTFQNSISYPLYLLGGAIVPVSLLPDWLHPLARVVFLSWSTDLLRDALVRDPVTNLVPRLAAVVGLGAAGYAVGFALIGWVINRARATGQVGYA